MNIFKNKSTFKKGFTLLELLVVIAILGVLSSVVLVSLSSAKNKGNDAATKAQLSKARDIAEQFIQGNGSGGYIGLCFPTTGLYNTVLVPVQKSSGATSIDNTTGNIGALNKVSCHEGANGWAISAPLKSESGYWCVDVVGFSGKRTNPLAASAFACPSS